MRAYQKDVFSLSAIVLLSLVCQGLCNADGTNALEQRVRSQDVAAINEAGSQGRTDLIPSLEAAANISADPDEPVRIWAKAALAKLGVKKYLDETAAELTTTNSELFAFYLKSGVCPFASQEERGRCATMHTQEIAFKKLAYIRNSSTVKVVAQFLYSNQIFHTAPDVPPSSTAGNAYMALRQMVDNPPALPAVHTHEEELRAWQQWWEQNKDKYP